MGRGDAFAGCRQRGGRPSVSDARAVRVQLSQEVIEVSGDGLDTRQLQLFFRGVLGGERVDGGWRIPCLGRPGNELIVRIARRLDTAGLQVEAKGDQVDLALQHEIERVRSFDRARRAGQVVLALDSEPAVNAPDAAALLSRLEEYGWDNSQRNLMPHQIYGLRHAMSAVNSANFSVPGSGKTAIALAVIACHLAMDHIDTVIIIGPLSAFRPWEREAAIALPGKLDIRRVRGVRRDDRVRIWRQVKAGELLLCSYASAASDRFEIERICRRLRVMLVVDESHRVKRFRGGLWASALLNIARLARIRMILTGTPMPQSPLDLWTQFNILWPGEEATGSRLSFRARADTNFRQLVQSLEPFFVRTPKSELGLSPPRTLFPPVELSPIQLQVYDLIFSRLRRAIPDAAAWPDKLDALRKARPMRLIQAASNPDLLNAEDGFFRIPPIEAPSGTLMERLQRYRLQGEMPAKFGWALAKLEELKYADQKCVVWTSFVRNIDQFTRLVRERIGVPTFSVDGRVPAAEMYGDEPMDELDETRERRIDQFLDHQGCSVLVANPAACGESISLHSRCHTAIYLDRTYDCARWLQSIDRIHRLGLPPGVIVEIHVPQVVMDGAPTIDFLVDAALRRKARTMSMLLEGAELRAAQAPDQDTLSAAEGDDQDLAALLRYLLGEQ
jgi:SNF2-related domain